MEELDAATWIGRHVDVVVDRPLGSPHPTEGFLYQLNYGFVPDTMSGDGEAIDAYVLGPITPVERFSGVVVAVIRRHDDVEDKLVVASEADVDVDAISRAVHFQEKYFRSDVLT